MKSEKEIFKHDLSNVEGSYTKPLQENITLINDLGTDVTIDLKTYVNKIIEIISSAKDTPAKRNFIMNLQKKRSKVDVMMYTNNAWLNGCGLGVI